jgi:hypothetical protein
VGSPPGPRGTGGAAGGAAGDAAGSRLWVRGIVAGRYPLVFRWRPLHMI